MASYYVNKNAQLNGDHEVHVTECSFMPDSGNRIYLGEFSNCRDSVRIPILTDHHFHFGT